MTEYLTNYFSVSGSEAELESEAGSEVDHTGRNTVGVEDKL